MSEIVLTGNFKPIMLRLILAKRIEVLRTLEPFVAVFNNDITTTAATHAALAYNLHFAPEHESTKTPKKSCEKAEGLHLLASKLLDPTDDGLFHDLAQFSQTRLGLGFETKH